jgi:Arc/MetJ family transcription regulator
MPPRSQTVRISVSVEHNLLDEAARLADIQNHSALVNEALRRFVEGEAARRLARLAGSQPNLKPIPRRRSAAPR